MPTDFDNIILTRGRKYNPSDLSALNDSLSYLPVKQRAAVLASILEESQGNPMSISSNKTYQGLLQWGADRYKIKNKGKRELSSQLQYLKSTIDNPSDHISWTNGGKGSGYKSYKDAYADFHNQSLPLDKVLRAFSYGYVRPSGKEDSFNNRLKVAEQIYNRLSTPEIPTNYIAQPDALRVARPLVPPAVPSMTTVPIMSNAHADGGMLYGNQQDRQEETMEPPKQWDDLSLREKNAFMASAVRHGITNIDDIRDAYNGLGGTSVDGSVDDASLAYNDDGSSVESDAANVFLNGGYKPSKYIKGFISHMEGSSMKTNRSFEAEAKDFWKAMPQDIRKRITQQQADALYSYSYNVGAGNFKSRVVPALERYFNGNGSMENVQRSMWASRDSQLRGLANRRAQERAMFAGSEVPVYYDTPASNGSQGNAWRSARLGPVTSINMSRGLGVVDNDSQGLLGPVSNDMRNKDMTQEAINTLYDNAPQASIAPIPHEEVGSIDRYNAIQDYLSSLGFLGYAEGGRMNAKLGVVSSNGQYHVSPSDYAGVLGNVSSGKPLEVTLPDTTVTASDPRNYRSYYDPNGAGDFLGATTLGLFPNPFNLSRSASTLMQRPSLGKAWDTAKDALMFTGGVGYDKAFAPLGLMNLIDKDGVRKTYGLIKDGNYAGATMSGLGVALNAGMAVAPLVTFIKPKYDFYRSVREFNKAKPTMDYADAVYDKIKKNWPLKGETQIPLDIKKAASKRYSDFIESDDYLNRLRNAGLEDHWDYMKNLTERRVKGNGYFPGNVKDIIDNDPKTLGLSSVEPTSPNFGITLQEDLSEKRIPQILDHELSHWATGNAGIDDTSNMLRYPFRYDPKVSKIGDIMRYNEEIVPNIEWDDIRKNLSKLISLDKATELYDDYKYLIRPTEKRARAYALYQQAKNEKLGIDDFVDKYTKNNRITDNAPDQLQDLANIMTPENIKTYLNKFLGITTPLGIGYTVHSNQK